jgi:hypothetical protein
MERSGMRWILSGARAMLDMRCIYLSGRWKEFTTLRIQRESRRLYSGYAADDPDFSTPLAAYRARPTGCTLRTFDAENPPSSASWAAAPVI